MSTVLALDLSTRSSGYALGKDGELVDYGLVADKSTDVVNQQKVKEKNLIDVLLLNMLNQKKKNKKYIINLSIKMRDFFSNYMKENKVDEIVLEEVHPDYNNSHTFRMLNWVQASIILAAYDIDPKIKITYLQASSWRCKIGIKTGPRIKRDVLKLKDMEYVKNKYDITANDDVCDAICILDAYSIKEKNTWD